MASSTAQRQAAARSPALREVTAVLLDAAAKLSPRQRRSLVTHQGELPKLIAAMIARLEPAVAAEADSDEGEGLGALLSETEGRRRLRAIAQPLALEAWAGPVAGSSALERSQGIPRSTLFAWQKQGAVVALLKGTRHHVFPRAQFVDGHPTPGIDAVLAAIGDPRTAWLWLVTEHPELGGARPLARLQAGARETVADLARRDYGQS